MPRKKNGYNLNGKKLVQIRTLNGVQLFDNQRYIEKDRSSSFSFLQGYCSSLGQEQGFQSKGLLEFISRYVCKLSYENVSLLLEDMIRQPIYTGNQIEHKIIALRPVIEAAQSTPYNGLQLSFNFVKPDINLYDPHEKEVLYYDDAVGVTKQKEHRKDKDYEKTERYVQTDNVLIEKPTHDFEYISANDKVLDSVPLEFQINRFLSAQYGGKIIPLVAITDGARTIRLRLYALFGVYVCIILDWYHLNKKVWQYFSRLGQTKANKERHIHAVLNYLWNGCVREALIYTEQEMAVPFNKQPFLEEFQNYLLKHETEIIDYDTRYRITGKSIGSGRGEKANDQIVAMRQKHNGCSWSEQGSAAIAQLQCLRLNNQWDTF